VLRRDPRAAAVGFSGSRQPDQGADRLAVMAIGRRVDDRDEGRAFQLSKRVAQRPSGGLGGDPFQRSAREITQLPPEQVAAALGPVLADGEIAKTGHNGKFDMTVLAWAGMPVSSLAFDTMIAAYLLGEKSVGHSML